MPAAELAIEGLAALSQVYERQGLLPRETRQAMLRTLRGTADAGLAPLLTRQEVATLLRVHVRTVDRYVHQGRLRRVNLSDGSARFDREEVNRLIHGGEHE